MFNICVVLIVILGGVPIQGAMTQHISVIPKTNDIADEVRVFTDQGDVAPPYKITTEVKRSGMRAYTFVYINGQQVLPHRSRRQYGLESPKKPSAFEELCRGASNIYFDLKEEGRPHQEIVNSVAEYFQSSPGIKEVHVQDFILTIVFNNSTSLEYWVSPGVSSYEAGAAAREESYESKLAGNYSLVFSSEKPIFVPPRNYQRLKAEIRLARILGMGRLAAIHWQVLDYETACAFNVQKLETP